MKKAIRLLTVLIGVGMLVTMIGCPKRQVIVEPEPYVEPEPEPVIERPVELNLTTIYFDYDKSEVRTGDAATLEANARAVKAAADKGTRPSIVIEGHCCPIGTAAYNMALGMRRAESVKTFLVRLGVAETQLSTISYGEERLATNDANRYELNRRAEFKVQPTK